MVKLKLWAFFITVTIILSCFTGCFQRSLPTDYRKSSFIATAELSDKNSSVTAKITAEEDCVYLELMTPDRLSGITLCREEAGDFLLCEDLRVPSAQYEYLFEWLDLMLPNGEIILTGETKIDGSDAVGAVLDGQDVEIYLDKSTYAPLKIIKKDRQITLISFKFVS